MQSIVLIIPYFGKLPNYFPVWKQSALANPTVDFLFFTDVDELQDEANIHTVHLSFEEFREIFQEKFDFPIAMNAPYKTCDFRPAYGYVLKQYIGKYDFWGHCDIDLIFGDIRKFITDDILENHQKILEHGHFTLYRNDEETNTVFMRCPGYGDYDYRKVFTSDESMYFDEALGMQLITQRQQTITYDNQQIFFDVLAGQKPFQHLNPYDGVVIFRYDKGRLTALVRREGAESREIELMYAHFQKRTMDYRRFQVGEAFYVVPNRLIPCASSSSTEQLFVCRGKRLYRLKQKIGHVQTYLRRYRQGSYETFAAYRAARNQFRKDLREAKGAVSAARQQL